MDMEHKDLSGPVNVTAPTPVENRYMMHTLRQAIGVPIGLPATEWMLEVGTWLLRTETELIIKSRRVIPAKLLQSGFTFEYATIEEAFAELLKRS
jgi:hypothetical protein